MTDRTPVVPGKIEISPNAIASIVGQTVLTCYGVVGMASRNLVDGLAEILHGDSSRRGVDVTILEGEIVVDLYLVLEYGVRIVAVAENVMSAVRFTVEKAIGAPVREVNVHVQGLRVSEALPRNKEDAGWQ